MQFVSNNLGYCFVIDDGIQLDINKLEGCLAHESEEEMYRAVMLENDLDEEDVVGTALVIKDRGQGEIICVSTVETVEYVKDSVEETLERFISDYQF